MRWREWAGEAWVDQLPASRGEARWGVRPTAMAADWIGKCCRYVIVPVTSTVTAVSSNVPGKMSGGTTAE